MNSQGKCPHCPPGRDHTGVVDAAGRRRLVDVPYPAGQTKISPLAEQLRDRSADTADHAWHDNSAKDFGHEATVTWLSRVHAHPFLNGCAK